jgi:hypothetical protein
MLSVIVWMPLTDGCVCVADTVGWVDIVVSTEQAVFTGCSHGGHLCLMQTVNRSATKDTNVCFLRLIVFVHHHHTSTGVH